MTYREKCRTVLARRARVDLAAEVMSDELHAVADAEHWDAGAERLRVDLWRAGLVNARRPAREDEPGRLPALQLVPRRRARDELAVHARLAHATRDELAVLRTEIQHEDRLASSLAFRLRPWMRGRGGGLQLRTSPCPRAGVAAGSCPPPGSTGRSPSRRAGTPRCCARPPRP